jgi:heme A synthase
MRTLRTLAYVTAAFAFAIIVLGFVVRITESGMGCGDDWPLCNGRIIPAFDNVQTVIEFAHRLAVLGLTALTVVMAVYAYKLRGSAGGSGPGGTLGPAMLAVVLLVVQSLLGAVTVKLELPPHSVILHLGAGLGLLAALVVLALRAGVHAGSASPPPGIATGRGGIIGATVLAAAVILMGGMVATTGAAPACQGFPLCNGQLWPTASASGLPHIHWTHRLLAYALFFHLIGMGLGLRRKQVAARVQDAAWIVAGLGVAQVVVGAVMVLSLLMPVWRTLHAALGTAIWVGLVYLLWLAPKAPAGAASDG